MPSHRIKLNTALPSKVDSDTFRRAFNLDAYAQTRVGKASIRRNGPPMLETHCAAPRKRNVKIVEVRTGEQVESVSVTITGWPANVNRKSGEHWTVTGKRVKAYHDLAAPLWAKALRGKALAGEWFTISIVYRGACRQDPHNCDKAAIDAAAQAVGINDRKCVEWRGEWRERTGERSHTVTLTAIKERV